MEKIRNDVLQGAEDNIRSLVAKKEPRFCMWSSLDLEDKSSIVEILNLFCNENIHHVLKSKEDVEKIYDPVWTGLACS